jgi:hypothetical protein
MILLRDPDQVDAHAITWKVYLFSYLRVCVYNTMLTASLCIIKNVTIYNPAPSRIVQHNVLCVVLSCRGFSAR